MYIYMFNSYVYSILWPDWILRMFPRTLWQELNDYIFTRSIDFWVSLLQKRLVNETILCKRMSVVAFVETFLKVNQKSIKSQSKGHQKSIKSQSKVNQKVIKSQSIVNQKSIKSQSKVNQKSIKSQSKVNHSSHCIFIPLNDLWREVGGWGRVPFSRNLMSPTPRRKWYLTTGRRFH